MARAGFVVRFLQQCGVAVLLGFLAACGGGGGDSGEPVRTVTTVTVTSPTATPKQGDTVQLTAVARDQFGVVMTGTTAAWSSSAPAVATVSSTGLLQALAGGSVTVTATISGVSGTLALTITPRVTTTVTVSSPTASPAVGEAVQLTVVARDQFGDVIPGKSATWSTANATIATISATGLLQALAPGAVIATATIDGVPGSLTLTVVPGNVLPAAYFIDGVEYAFDYQLDAQGRVDSFRISRRAEIAYPTPPDSDFNPIECTGSLHGRYDCASEAGIYFRTMQGEVGVAMSVDYGNPAERTLRSYAYDPVGLKSVVWRRGYVSIHRYDTGSEKLNYDAGGRLASVNETNSSCDYFCLSATADIPIVVDSTGRLLRAERTPVAVPPYAPPPGTMRSVTTWTYDSRGYMAQMDVTEYEGIDVARTSSTRYTADADGWLTSRVVHSEDRYGVVTEKVDRYSFVRPGGHVEEESFTQAEPSGFYRQRARQRVRYEANRLPTEPLFVPRALTGLRGADYVGVISSHDR